MLTADEAVQHLEILTSGVARGDVLLQVVLVGKASSGKTTVLQAVHARTSCTKMIYCAMHRSIQEIETHVLAVPYACVLLLDDACVFNLNELISALQASGRSFIAASRRPTDDRCDCITLEAPRSIAASINENVISFCSPIPPYCGHMTRAQCILLSILHMCMHSSPSQDEYRFGRTTLKRKGQNFKQNLNQTMTNGRTRSSRVSVTRLKACFQAYSCLQTDALSSTVDVDDMITSLISSRCIACTRGPTQSKTYLQCILTDGELAIVRAKANIMHGLMD
ncbi:Hypothetical protein GLP15_2960 [Giardia lamblia P15]|uniref:Uncharacterized protein n=1 Tax=Giardia intestinalis (strain P15) TaxID=658858 RepID=E1EYU8_GIAIA|nr:Hypothetical protein GLP15_2960 [Giardia lamblia P15]